VIAKPRQRLSAPRSPQSSNRELALSSRVTHSFRPGLGYFDHTAPPPMPLVARGFGHECAPPAGTQDGSLHWLVSPGNGRQLQFAWVARERAWERPGGIRMAFTAEYLAAHGWRYVRPA